jgi:hypothetical protein
MQDLDKNLHLCIGKAADTSIQPSLRVMIMGVVLCSGVVNHRASIEAPSQP